VWDNPIDLGTPEWNKRVVYSPHVYGPDAFEQDYFTDKSFPKNLPAIWDAQWAFAEEATGRAISVGEWGGKYVVQQNTAPKRVHSPIPDPLR
jgi:endoglucanase